MAHIKYLYFAKICREQGEEVAARHFEETAKQEVQHAFGHADLLFPRTSMTPAKCLAFAIAGEAFEYTEMYPGFRHQAVAEGRTGWVAAIDEQIAESREHAEQFKAVLKKAAKCFAALAKVEERHANAYQAVLEAITEKAA
jgi:rubrerythrin